MYLFQNSVLVIEAVKQWGAATDVPSIDPLLLLPALRKQQPHACLAGVVSVHTGVVEWSHLGQVQGRLVCTCFKEYLHH